ncbi:hypothetical protein ACH4ZX_11970 [Streptomyces sp. NPDC020490]|uniref:hypothetical protein n=1 Tax=Streptomyces sp. NPDC020490 TaxID=3365078 RepID=UPI0037A69DA1
MNAQQVEFLGVCGHLMSVPASLSGTDVQCQSCHQVTRAPMPFVPGRPPAARSGSTVALTALYIVSLLVGLGAAAVIYVVKFNDLSEDQLVGFTPLWFFPIVFGLYGFVSQRLLRALAEGRAGTLSEAARLYMRLGGLFAVLTMFPFLVLKLRSSLLVSLAAALFWAGLLWFFFAAVFPEL